MKNTKLGIIYTCITGNYDDLKDYSFKNSDWDYVCFTDNKDILNNKKSMWKIKPLAFGDLDDVRNQRWHKLHPHILFPEYKKSIWLDANVDITSKEMFDDIDMAGKEGAAMSIAVHPDRDCIYKEAQACIDLGKDNEQTIRRQVQILKEKSFPQKNGLFETNIVYREHNNKKVIKIMNDWWWWIENYSRRDQLSLNYVLWKNDFRVRPLSRKGIKITPNVNHVTKEELLVQNQNLGYAIKQKSEEIQAKNAEIQKKDEVIQLKDKEIQEKNRELQLKNAEMQQKSQEISSHLREIQRMTTSRFWKIKTFYEKFKNPILRHFFTFNRLSKKAIFVFKRDGLKKTVSCAAEYLFSSGKLSKELKREVVFEGDDTPYKKWIKNIERKQKMLDYQDIEKKIKKLSYQPKISVIFPVFNTDEIFLRKAIFSVIEQYYQNWELCIVDDRSERIIIKKILDEFGNRDPRIKVKYLEKNLGISGATNEAAKMATGEFIAFLDHDDELEPEALYENIKLLNGDKELDLIYSDDDKIDENGFRYDPQFKPDWSPELLLSYCYVSHFKVLRKKLFIDLGGFRDKFNGSQDYDFLLRLAEKTDKVGHISKILYHWRSIPGSVAHSSAEKPASIERGRMAVQEALDRRGIEATVSIPDFAEKARIGVYKIDFDAKKYQDRVTIIIPTKDNVSILKRCIDSIRNKTNYSNYEILVIDNNSVEKNTAQYLKEEKLRTINIKTDKFNFSKINNVAVEQVKSEFVLFLNNDTEVISPNWLLEMVGSMQMNKKIGAVGAKLIYFDGRIQHAGVLLGLHNNSAGHAHKLAHKDDPGYLCYASVLRNYSAVTAACLLTRKSLFDRVGGFDEKKLSVSYNDVDFCLKLLRLGYRTVYNPNAILYHHEGKSRGFIDNPDELNHFKNTWKEHIADDRYYNVNLSLENEKFEIKQKN